MAPALTWDHDLTGYDALSAIAPTTATQLDLLGGAIAGPPEWVDVVRTSCAAALEVPPLRSDGAIARTRPTAEGTAHHAVSEVAAFASQFSLDVSAFDGPRRRTAEEAIGTSLAAAHGRLLSMTWAADFIPRVRVALDRLFRPSPWPTAREFLVADARPLALEFLRAVYHLRALDPMTAELVRLLGARAHNCRLCRSLRSKTALDHGATESDFEAVERYEQSDLAPAGKAALALADSMIWTPARLGDPIVERVRANLSPMEAVEVVLDVMRNSWNKTMVVAELDEPHVTQGTEVHEYRNDGTVHYGLARP